MPRRNGGVALIIALVVVAIVTLLAVTVSGNFLVNFRQTQNQQLLQAAWGYFAVAEGMARINLLKDMEETSVDLASEAWSTPVYLPAFEFNNVSVGIGGQLKDLQGRFNLNLLRTPYGGAGSGAVPGGRLQYTEAQQQFIRLLQTYETLDLDQSTAIGIAEAVFDWIDTDDRVTGLGGREDYSDADMPRRTADGGIASVSELLWVQGITKEIYEAIKDDLTVWPIIRGAAAGTGEPKININTASINVLRSFSVHSASNAMRLTPLSKADAEQWQSDVDKDGAMKANVQLHSGRVDTAGMATSVSNYFLLDASVEFMDRRYNLQSVIHRKAPDSVKVIARSYGDI